MKNFRNDATSQCVEGQVIPDSNSADLQPYGQPMMAGKPSQSEDSLSTIEVSVVLSLKTAEIIQSAIRAKYVMDNDIEMAQS